MIPLSHFNYQQGDHTSPEIDVNFVGDLHIGQEVDNFAAEVLKDQHTTLARPYPVLTTADFDPSNRDYKDSMAKPDSTLANLPTGGWNDLNTGIKVEIGDEKLRAPAWDATSGTNNL